MSDKCDSLKALAELTTRLEKYQVDNGTLDYENTRKIIEKLTHEIQIKRNESANDIKKEMGIYHND